MHPYRKFIAAYQPLTDQEWEAVSACLTRREIRRGDLLLRAGEVCRHVWFLETGLLRYFTLPDGVDRTKFFTVAPYCFTSQRSFATGEFATESIEALEDGVLWTMTRADAYRLFTIVNWNEFVRRLTQEVQYFTELILEDLQNKTAEVRYRELLLSGDPLARRAPLRHLASYLGIAPQSLSRIRKRSNLT